MSATDVFPLPCRRPRFPKDQLVLEPTDDPILHQLDPENAIIIIKDVIDDPETYIQSALQVSRTSPLVGTPAGPVPIPRSQICYTTTGAPYIYSKTKHDTTPYPSHVLNLIQELIAKFNDVVPENTYVYPDTAADLMYSSLQKNGGSISPHSDDENSKWGLVLIHTLGQSRYLRIRDKNKQSPYVNVRVDHNSLIAMYGPTFQGRYTHQVDPLKPGEEIGVRLSLNVRYVSDPTEVL